MSTPMSTINLKCQCGDVQGTATELSPRSSNRVVCCCSDCQAFAAFLDPDAPALDSAGGTDIYQTSQSQIKIHAGQENLRVMKLSPKGLLRFYTSCCKTPVGNAMSGALPFFGIIHTFIDVEDLDAALGEVQAYCQTQDAKGTVDHPKAHPKFPLALTARILSQILIWKLQGKHKPSAFFDQSGQPISPPHIAA